MFASGKKKRVIFMIKNSRRYEQRNCLSWADIERLFGTKPQSREKLLNEKLSSNKKVDNG